MHRVAFSVDDIDQSLKIAARHGCHPLRGVATYEDIYKLTYVRGHQRHHRHAGSGPAHELSTRYVATASVRPDPSRTDEVAACLHLNEVNNTNGVLQLHEDMSVEVLSRVHGKRVVRDFAVRLHHPDGTGMHLLLCDVVSSSPAGVLLA